jgi:hypothetical protein
MSVRNDLVPEGVTLLPAPALCFRTWRPSRGPMRTLLKDLRSSGLFWLSGPDAALWGWIESGVTLGRLRRHARTLHSGDQPEDWIDHWVAHMLRTNLVRPQGRLAQGRSAHEIAEVLVARLSSAPPSLGAIVQATDPEMAQAWLLSQGLPYEAHWALEPPFTNMREVMDRLDFLKDSGVFRIRFTGTQTPASIRHVLNAARALGFECVGVPVTD